mmetsp:Transcript_160128/g.295159  ORF Transcript_160128/g.295159 Transcript_160128/m.295159 type:complete len:81 (+) Transcript_160128:40-282(+)
MHCKFSFATVFQTTVGICHFGFWGHYITSSRTVQRAAGQRKHVMVVCIFHSKLRFWITVDKEDISPHGVAQAKDAKLQDR